MFFIVRSLTGDQEVPTPVDTPAEAWFFMHWDNSNTSSPTIRWYLSHNMGDADDLHIHGPAGTSGTGPAQYVLVYATLHYTLHKHELLFTHSFYY